MRQPCETNLQLHGWAAGVPPFSNLLIGIVGLLTAVLLAYLSARRLGLQERWEIPDVHAENGQRQSDSRCKCCPCPTDRQIECESLRGTRGLEAAETGVFGVRE